MHFHTLRVCAEASAQAGVALPLEPNSRAWFAASVLEKYALSLAFAIPKSEQDFGFGVDPGRLRGYPLAHLTGTWW
jgi:hypothetical protein